MVSFFSCSQSKNDDNGRLDKYITFIKGIKLPAKDYVISLFDNHDIVILCERYHAEVKQYELITDIIKDQRFIDKVGNICTEIGGVNYADSLNNYLKYSADDSIQSLIKLKQFQRDFYFEPIWSKFSYHTLLKTIFNLNRNLEPSKRINLYPCDDHYDWYSIFSKAQRDSLADVKRDSVLAVNISNRFEQIKSEKRKKLLVILNEYHSFINPEWKDIDGFTSAGQFLSKKYGTQKMANVLINTIGESKQSPETLIQGGYWDAAFDLAGNPSVGFDFRNSPFGNDHFDYVISNTPKLRYKDMFTGMVFYSPIKDHLQVYGVPGIIDSAFKPELYRRWMIRNPKYLKEKGIDAIVNDYNTPLKVTYDSIKAFNKRITEIERKYYAHQNRTLTVNLHGMKYDSLLISGVDLNNKAQLRRKGTALNDSCWLFSIPDPVYNNWKYFFIMSQYITENDPTQRIIVSVRIMGKDTLKTQLYNFDDRLPVIDAFYLKSHTTKERFVRKRNNVNELFEATQIADLFEVKCGEDKDIVLRMKYPNFSFFTEEDDKGYDYNACLREYVSIVKANPESQFLLIALSRTFHRYHSKEDVEKVFNNFSSKARQSSWGQRIQNYLTTKYFSNGILPECNSGKEESIIRDTAKYTLVLFSASWCGPCIRQIPALKEIYNDLSGKLDMVYISLDESRTVNNWKKLMANEKIKWRSLIAADKINQIEQKYLIRGIPADILVSPGGLMEEIDLGKQSDKEKLYKILSH